MSSGAAAAVGEAVALGTSTIVAGEGSRRTVKTTTNIAKSFVDNVIKKKVSPLTGCIVYCDLAFGNAEHSGVYTYGQIVELEGNGRIREVSPSQFIDSSTVRTAISIYIACDEDGNVLHDYDLAARAAKMIGSQRNYNLVLDNCHQFTSGCITGNFENADNFFWMLSSTISQEMNNGKPIKWYVWDR